MRHAILPVLGTHVTSDFAGSDTAARAYAPILYCTVYNADRFRQRARSAHLAHDSQISCVVNLWLPFFFPTALGNTCSFRPGVHVASAQLTSPRRTRWGTGFGGILPPPRACHAHALGFGRV